MPIYVIRYEKTKNSRPLSTFEPSRPHFHDLWLISSHYPKSVSENHCVGLIKNQVCQKVPNLVIPFSVRRCNSTLSQPLTHLTPFYSMKCSGIPSFYPSMK